MLKTMLIILGVLLTSIGLTCIILYLNLLVMGYSLIKYLIYIITHFWTLLFFIGIIMIYIGIKK